MDRENLREQSGLFSPQVRRASAMRQTGTERSPARRLTEEPPATSPHHAGYHAGLHPVDAPYTSTEFRPHSPQRRATVEDEEAGAGEYDDGEPPRTPTSAYRYPRSAPARTTKVVEPLYTRRLRRFHAHWLFVAGIVLVVMMAGWWAFSALGSWWQMHQDDATYGRPRTFQIDAVVGHHGDSRDHPSHFLAWNLYRQVIVIELPAGNPSKAIIYTAGTLLGDGEGLTPVTLSFEDRNGDGRPDLNIHLGDQVMVFLNNGQKFVAPQQHTTSRSQGTALSPFPDLYRSVWEGEAER